MPLVEVLNYFRKYDTRTFEATSCQGSEPTEEDVKAFEATVGFRLPDEFRDFTMSPLGGLYFAVREEYWPRPIAYEVGPFWSFLYGICVFGIAEGIPDWLDIREQYKQFKSQGYSDLVPFLAVVGNADHYCFDSRGQIIEWSHEEPDKRLVIETTFTDLLMEQIQDLEARKEKKLRDKRSQ